MNNNLIVAAFALTFAASALAGCSKSSTVQSASNGKLTLVKPAAVTIYRGGMTKAAVKIQRADLLGDVSIAFTDLPKGVDVVDSGSKIVGDEGSYTLRAGDDAALVENYSATVTATTGTGGIAVSEPITISVKVKQ
ncbi:MAG: hypothetical protein K8T90_20660 [Planctomycetes bacterium]|nr:hypothetical protein [Planctomycetota bacterium]